MGCCNSKDTLKDNLLEYNYLSDSDFTNNLKSKLDIVDNPDGFDIFVYFILIIRSQKLFPVNNNKLVSCNYNDLKFINIKNAILESNQKNKIFKLINLVIKQINNEFLLSSDDKNNFYVYCLYLFNHRNYIQMI